MTQKGKTTIRDMYQQGINPEDLMVGDWVNCKYYQSMSFYHQFGVGDFIKGGYNFVEPIPITSEILEKNGFEQYGKDAYCFSIPIQMAGDGFEQQNITIHRMKVLELRTSTCTLLMPIKFVHQLQHALKLCGIEKEIVV